MMIRCSAVLNRLLAGCKRLGRQPRCLFPLVLILVLFSANQSAGYSLLTHEEIVDILWAEKIRVLLLRRYPGATEKQLREAHAYAYGGSLIQDIGYYPFGNHFFSDLTHYVRTGDFVANLIHESEDLDQYAFALGALAHYSSDIKGHPLINHAVALTFPKLKDRFGDEVTYEENPKAHIQTEFGFDITQVAKARYTSDRYHDFIGFGVSKPLLERAFSRTYGLQLEQVLGNVELAIGTFRYAVSRVIPEMTRAALSTYHPEIVRDTPNFNKKQFLYNLSRAQYETEWGKEYRKPGFLARFLGFIVRWIPKVGVFQALAFRIPTSQTEDLYLKSVNDTVADYQHRLQQIEHRDFGFPNLDCDTGKQSDPGEYKLTDETYARLLDSLVRHGLIGVQPDLRSNILAFYAEARGVPAGHRGPKGRLLLQEELTALKAGPGSPLAAQIQKQVTAAPFRLQSPKAKDA